MKNLLLIFALLSGLHMFAQDVVINEILSQNKGLVKNDAGNSFDYIELYNSSAKTVDLSGYFLSDHKDTLKMFTIPAGTIIAPKGFILLWANGDANAKELNTNFKLSQKGEKLFLSFPDGTLCHALKYKRQFSNISYGLLPDGGIDKDYLIPTPEKVNKTGSIFVSDLKGKSETLVTITMTENKYSVKLLNPEGETHFVKVLDNKTDKVLYKTKLESASATIYFSTYEKGKYKLLIGKDTYRILKR
ncbi:MAG: hypothetical protein ACI8YC_001310 [Salibacteraceae bacterium]|jgi:hypothetical protein